MLCAYNAEQLLQTQPTYSTKRTYRFARNRRQKTKARRNEVQHLRGETVVISGVNVSSHEVRDVGFVMLPSLFISSTPCKILLSSSSNPVIVNYYSTTLATDETELYAFDQELEEVRCRRQQHKN